MSESEPSTPALHRCSECHGLLSKVAVLCPTCGKQYQHLVVDQKGWIWTIVWGVIVAGITVVIANAVILFLVLVFLAGVGGAYAVPHK